MLLICLIAFCSMMQSSFALKCYRCETASNSKCADLTDKSFQPEECVVDSFLSQGANLFSQLGFGGNSNNVNKDNVSPVCLKIVSKNITIGHYVSRKCSVKIVNQDPCSFTKTAFQQAGSNSQLDFCGACDDKDGCNSGNTMKIVYALVVFATMVSTARLFV